jgi:hypothetical protein
LLEARDVDLATVELLALKLDEEDGTSGSMFKEIELVADNFATPIFPVWSLEIGDAGAPRDRFGIEEAAEAFNEPTNGKK